MNDTELHICAECNPPHVDNCPRCFGYGMGFAGAPITAAEAEQYRKFFTPYSVCLICGGTPFNLHLLKEKG